MDDEQDTRRVDGLHQQQGDDDRQTIADLRARSEVDQHVLAALTEQGVADRAQIEQLRTALVAARRIGAAMGILMASLKVPEDQAFELLRTGSQNTNRKLRDLADDVVYSGVLDGAGSRPA